MTVPNFAEAMPFRETTVFVLGYFNLHTVDLYRL